MAPEPVPQPTYWERTFRGVQHALLALARALWERALALSMYLRGVWPRLRLTLQRVLIFAKRLAPFASGVLTALIALLLYNTAFPPPRPLTARDVSDTVANALASATPPPARSAQVFRAILPSFVLIEVKKEAQNDDDSSEGLGSGVIVNDAGDILTSLHVVADATEITLFFADGTESSAEITVEQPEKDIAVLRATQPPAQIIPAVLGNPNALRIGDEAYVVGNPFGLYASMSTGVISGFDRSFKPEKGEYRLEGLIQIDAAVNPGNSGGPLVNRYGQVVGIITGLINPSDDEVFIGIGFAMPIDVAAAGAGLPPH